MSKLERETRGIELLSGERDHLLASIADLEREYQAGDVSDRDYVELRARYMTRAAATLRELDLAQGAAQEVVRQSNWRVFRHYLARRRTRRILIVATVLCGCAAIGIAAASLSGARLFGEQATGSVNLPSTAAIREDLTQASLLGSQGQLLEAVALYNSVLQSVPNQPEALTYKGWLERLAGIGARSQVSIRAGDALLAHAVLVAPRYPDARAFDGLALLEDDKDIAGAIVQFQAFLSDKPPANLLQALGAQMAATFVKAHQGLPAVLAPYRHD